MTNDYRTLVPETDEGHAAYTLRLQDLGHEEMFIRLALRFHFDMPLADMGAYFKNFELARLRHIKLLTRIAPNRTKYSLMKKVSKNLGISEEDAKDIISRFHKADPNSLEYLSNAQLNSV